jgi:hypothetical protein
MNDLVIFQKDVTGKPDRGRLTFLAGRIDNNINRYCPIQVGIPGNGKSTEIRLTAELSGRLNQPESLEEQFAKGRQ